MLNFKEDADARIEQNLMIPSGKSLGEIVIAPLNLNHHWHLM